MTLQTFLGRLILVLVGLFAFVVTVGCLLVVADMACAGPKTQEVLRDILEDHDSPLAAVAATPSAYWRSHRSFDLAGWLAVVAAETSLGRDGFAARTRNVGCIRGGSVGKPWRDLRVGTTASGFNVYPNLRAGVRASILLIANSPRGYNALLGADDWRGFTRAYWGSDYATHPEQREAYIRDLRRFHDQVVREARARGLRW